MHMKTNMLDYGEQIARDVADGKLARDSVVVCCADRAKGKVYRQTYTVGAVPTLTTSNKYLFLVNVAEVMDKVPMAQRTLFRWVRPLERLCFSRLQPRHWHAHARQVDLQDHWQRLPGQLAGRHSGPHCWRDFANRHADKVGVRSNCRSTTC